MRLGETGKRKEVNHGRLCAFILITNRRSTAYPSKKSPITTKILDSPVKEERDSATHSATQHWHWAVPTTLQSSKDSDHEKDFSSTSETVKLTGDVLFEGRSGSGASRVVRSLGWVH